MKHAYFRVDNPKLYESCQDNDPLPQKTKTARTIQDITSTHLRHKSNVTPMQLQCNSNLPTPSVHNSHLSQLLVSSSTTLCPIATPSPLLPRKK